MLRGYSYTTRDHHMSIFDNYQIYTFTISNGLMTRYIPIGGSKIIFMEYWWAKGEPLLYSLFFYIYTSFHQTFHPQELILCCLVYFAMMFISPLDDWKLRNLGLFFLKRIPCHASAASFSLFFFTFFFFNGVLLS